MYGQCWLNVDQFLIKHCLIPFKLFRHRCSLNFYENMFRHWYIKYWLKYLHKITKWLQDEKNDRYFHVIFEGGCRYDFHCFRGFKNTSGTTRLSNMMLPKSICQKCQCPILLPSSAIVFLSILYLDSLQYHYLVNTMS